MSANSDPSTPPPTHPTAAEAADLAPYGAGGRDRPLRIAVIVGSIREGRLGRGIAEWFVAQVEDRDDLTIDLVDLAEASLTTVYPDDETHIPDNVAVMSVRLAAADGFVVVVPEYNHSYPASLKNAIDWFYEEWTAKPVAFVSYGGRAQGIRAVEHLRNVFIEVRAMTTRDGISIDLSDVGDDGLPNDEGIEVGVKLTLDELTWWARALRDARALRPYGG
jgi:NAD(P)H-dependent FMN reductase